MEFLVKIQQITNTIVVSHQKYNFHTIPTLMIEDQLLSARKIEKQDKTMIGGNCSDWYGGFDSYLMEDIYENPIDMPKMRNVDLHDQLPRLTILPHIWFTDWIHKLENINTQFI